MPSHQAYVRGMRTSNRWKRCASTRWSATGHLLSLHAEVDCTPTGAITAKMQNVC